jgi:branched-chain amino acid transport system permease protein
MAILISVLGGIGRIEGPVIGTAIYFLLRELSANYGVWYFVALGLIAIATMVLSPQGTWGLVLRRWPSLDPLRTRRWMP